MDERRAYRFVLAEANTGVERLYYGNELYLTQDELTEEIHRMLGLENVSPFLYLQRAEVRDKGTGEWKVV